MSFRVSAMHDGKVRRVELRESTGVKVDAAHPETAKKAAWGVLKARLRQIQHPQWDPYHEKVTVSELLDAYTTLMLPQVRNPYSMRYAVTFLREAFGAFHANALAPEQVDAWRAQMCEAGYSQGTVDRILRVLRAAYHLAVDDHKVDRMPRISLYAPDDRRLGFVEGPEFEAIHRALAQLDEVIADMWVFSYWSGRRPGELEALTWPAVDLTRRTLTIERPKRRRDQAPKSWIVVLEGELWAVIERRLAVQRAEGRIVPHVFHRAGRPIDHNYRNRIFDRARQAAGFPGRIWYDLRRSAARDLINAGVDQATVMATLGHTSPAMFARYGIRVDRDLRSAQQRLAESREQSRGQLAVHGQVLALQVPDSKGVNRS